MKWMPLLIACVCTILSSCQTTRGPTRIVSATGSLVPTGSHGLTQQFFQAEASASADGARADHVKAQAMMRAGYELIYADCSDFFTSAGTTQKWLVFSRDTVGAIGTLTSAVLALHNAGKNAVANVSLVTGGVFTGLDIYTKDFLFSAENVDSVRELTLKALDVHQAAVGFHDDDTYGSATVALLDNQNICSPAAITALAREAIKKGDVASSEDVSDDLKQLEGTQDRVVLGNLGRLLHPPTPLSLDEAGALWAMLESTPSAEQRKIFVAKLAGLDSDKSPLDANGSYKPSWPLLNPVLSQLETFSAATKQAFDKAATQPPPGTLAGTAGVSSLTDLSRPRTRHVTVHIK